MWRVSHLLDNAHLSRQSKVDAHVCLISTPIQKKLLLIQIRGTIEIELKLIDDTSIFLAFTA